MIKIQIPATSANIGPGFDSLGLALRLYNRVWMEEADGIHISTTDGSDVPCGENNLIYKTVAFLYKLCGRPFHGLRISQENNIPMTRGLGSSSACIVAGLLGANTLLGNPLPKADIVNLAAVLEGHPDNSTPAILGGLTAAVLEESRVYSVKVPISGRLKFAAFIPDFELKTEKARAALPAQVRHKDAVFNLSRTALMIASLFSGRLDNLRVAVEDKLHQPYRLGLIPGAEDVFALCIRLGAYACYISGAGPTLMAMVNVTDLSFQARAEEALQELPQKFRLEMLDCDETGATVETTEE
ncbi:homoserine kinase [Ethanoligenens harbinense]|uniref:Homoserine kinase n=1 Tax=Ethanoligenens harbinense (strain DSM 18485 / JCM 12961 / CGMCC 1.5033 / YUAN-3) TaxID=663278 RepID=E6U8D9_ETHHY|nr:homoserine kinase [Ethanoligenens harbinense]ADU28258.1 homoserine kinase [Ethanoligenens harbinense YUAN-3]AVQ97254.1 homoserine kinase [Ethanoligenens harbinense YUAN-3]AYF39919.1 homoserine kinase [Ethanoligenens harbinense]AYF42749.1 homoserine kinase [Ethanoligenens harbinense]QCN93499.1 homoserine kinase [Ethanoligenens harbinense]